MINRNLWLLAPLALLLACGGETASDGASNSQPKSEGEIEAALRAYLNERTDLNLKTLQLDIVNVSQTGDSATATAEFRAEAGAAKPLLAMGYALSRVDGKWEVQGSGRASAAAETREEAGLPPGHPPTNPPSGGDAGALPPGHTPMDAPSGGGGLPPGHPPTGGSTPSDDLPAGHPR